MSIYFNQFPKLNYNMEGTPYKNRTVLTDITFRLKIREKVKENLFSYYTVDISDDDTIEILAAKYYGDSEYHWIIALANDIVDPQYDWPLNYRSYVNYINNKYGSAANADLTVHHYEKVIKRYNQYSRTTDEIIIEIQEDAYNAMPAYSFRQFNLADGVTVEETITRRVVTASEWEYDRNNKKKQLKIIKKDYLPNILSEFENFTRNY